MLKPVLCSRSYVKTITVQRFKAVDSQCSGYFITIYYVLGIAQDMWFFLSCNKTKNKQETNQVVLTFFKALGFLALGTSLSLPLLTVGAVASRGFAPIFTAGFGLKQNGFDIYF